MEKPFCQRLNVLDLYQKMKSKFFVYLYKAGLYTKSLSCYFHLVFIFIKFPIIETFRRTQILKLRGVGCCHQVELHLFLYTSRSRWYFSYLVILFNSNGAIGRFINSGVTYITCTFVNVHKEVKVTMKY